MACSICVYFGIWNATLTLADAAAIAAIHGRKCSAFDAIHRTLDRAHSEIQFHRSHAQS